VQDKFFFLNGSKEQEYFSDYIARAILIPTRHIKEAISNTERIKSLKWLNWLIQTFNVEYDKLLKRLLHDLNIIESVMIFRFVQFHNDNAWKLLETFASENLRHDKRFYIPSRNFDTTKIFKDRLPSCEGELSKLLTEISNNNLQEDIHLTVDASVFANKPTLAIKDKTPAKVPILATTKINRYNSKVVNLLIDFENIAQQEIWQNAG
jgi:hypothetical protein